jgi:hypothetical protein
MKKLWVLVVAMVAAAAALASGVGPTPASAMGPMTFYASESGCGPNSIWQAIQNANSNPGVDTIEIQAGLVFGADSTTCDSINFRDAVVGTFTESAIVNGNGSSIRGFNQFVSPAGISTPPVGPRCGNNADIWVAASGRLFAIGEPNADNTGITVAVDAFDAKGLSGLFVVRRGAELEVSNSSYRDIWNISDTDCSRPAVQVLQDATFTARDTQFVNVFSSDDTIQNAPTPLASMISGLESTVNLDRVSVDGSLDGYAIHNRNGTTRIVSSIFTSAGGFLNNAGSTMDIVNTAWTGRTDNFSGQTDQIHNRGTMRINASTFWVRDTSNCEQFPASNPYRCPSNAAPLLNEGVMTIEGTAVGTDVSQVYPDGYSTPVTGGEIVTNQGSSWIGPTRPSLGIVNPGSDSWINTFVEPDPDTGSPGLDGIMPVIDVLGDGVLIDRIDCPANPLLNPIDSTPINTDVFGNPRCDAGNDMRNIGAVQTQTAPHLVLIDVSSGQVNLTWTAPEECPSPEEIGGYHLYRRPIGGSFGAPIIIDGPGTLSHSDTGLTNGQQYEYEIRARCGFSTGGTFIDISESAPSNLVGAVPFGAIGTPIPAAVRGDRMVNLTWTTPDLGGRNLLNYFVVYFPVGTTDYGFEATAAPAIAIGGLANGTDYQFMVFALATTGENGSAGLVDATPAAVPSAPQPSSAPGDGQVTLTWLTPPDGGSAITGYLVEYRPTGGTTWTSTGPGRLDTTRIIDGLTNGTAYEFRVAAVNGVGIGPFSLDPPTWVG